MIDYGLKNNRRSRYILVKADNFSENGVGVPLKNKPAPTLSNELSRFIHESNRKPSLIETDYAEEFLIKVLTEIFYNV